MINLLLLILHAQGCTLLPKTSRPILLTRNNRLEVANYTFSFQITNFSPSTSHLMIEFPPFLYATGLGLSSCGATNWNGEELTCTVSDKTVDVPTGELSNVNPDNTFTVTLHDVPNPTVQSGVGMFKLNIVDGINYINYCDYFAELGITYDVTPITTHSILCLSNCVAGMISNYSISYTLSKDYEPTSRIYINFPIGMDLSIMTCSSTLLTNITCIFDSDNKMTISGVDYWLAATDVLDISFTDIINPPVSGSVGNFDIWSMEPIVNTVIEEVTGVVGPVITENSLIIDVCPSVGSATCLDNYPYQSLNNTQYYYISLTTSNPIPKGGLIDIQFSTDFVIRSESCKVETGLVNQGFTEDDQILCVVDSVAQTVVITNFGDALAGLIELNVIATNPNITATYSGFSAETYYDTGRARLIDKSAVSTVTIDVTFFPGTWTITWSDELIVDTAVTVSIIFRPTTQLLVAPDVSYRINLPDEFDFNGAPTGLYMPQNVFPDYPVTTTWDPVARSIFLDGSTCGCTDMLPHDDDNRIQVTGGGFQLPDYPGKYFIEFIMNFSGVDTEAFVHEVDVLPAGMSGSAKSYSDDIEVKSLYEVTFTPTIDVPNAKVPELPTDSWGTVDIVFPTMNSNLQEMWPMDLGSGKSDLDTFPCKPIVNLVQISGDNVSCKIILATGVSTTDEVIVRITNFETIYAFVPVTIHIADIVNIFTDNINPYLTVKTYAITQRVYQLLNDQIFTFPRRSFSDEDANLPVVNGRSPEPNGDGLNLPDYLPNTVNSSTQMQIILWTEEDVDIGGHIYIKFPTSYPLVHSEIKCYINWSNEHTCYTYPDAGWIAVFSLTLSIINHVEYTLTVNDIVNPRHVVDPESLQMVMISNNKEIEYFYFTPMNYFDVGPVSPVNVWPSSYKALAVDVTYYWLFTLANGVPVGGSIVLSFPKKDYSLNIDPLPECYIETVLEPTDSIVCTVVGNAVTITGFDAVPAGEEIEIHILNIINPPDKRTTDYFSIETYSEESRLIDGEYFIPKLSIETKIEVESFTFVDFYADPSNGNSLADYTISILPSVTVPTGSYIEITFPYSEYPTLPSPPTCTLSDGLTTLEGCSSTGDNVIVVVTDQDYEKTSLSTPINITIYDIRNFSPGITSGLLELEITYSGIVVNENPESEDKRKITTSDLPSLLTLDSMVFSPKTAGERAEYVFTFTPTVSFDSSCNVGVKFPEIFARGLSDNIRCFSSDISTRSSLDVRCWVEDRTLMFIETTGSDSTFSVQVQFIMNPQADSGGLSIEYFTQCGLEYVNFGESTLSFNYTALPTSIFLAAATSAGSNVLYPQEHVNMIANTTTNLAGSATDLVFVDFPPDYDLYFVGPSIYCTSTYVSSATCTYGSNRVMVAAYDPAVSNAAEGQVDINLYNIENPAEEGQAQYITVGIYEDATDLVIAKTYSNINRPDPFSYTIQGVVVTVNNNLEFTMTAGTSTQQMEVRITGGSPNYVEIVPNVATGGCVVTPNPVIFFETDLVHNFIVTCPTNAEIGEYYIIWTFAGDWPSSYWSPIERTFFWVEAAGSESVTLGQIGMIPQGGISSPVEVELSSPVANDISFTLEIVGGVPTGASVSPTMLNFTTGDYLKTFVVSISATSIGLEGQVQITASGSDRDVFSLPASYLSFSVGEKDGSSPTVVDSTMDSVARNGAEFSITVNEKSVVYWMVSRYGTRSPTLQESIAGELSNAENINDTPIFGQATEYTSTSASRYSYKIDVSGLLAQTNYTMHFLVMDYGGNEATTLPTHSFSTSDRYNSATFPLKFTAETNQTQIQEQLKVIASALNIEEWRVVERTDYTGGTGVKLNTDYSTGGYTSSSGVTRRVQDFITEMDVIILPDPASESSVTPLILANSFQDYKSALKAVLPTFDDTYFIEGQNIYGVKPVFRTMPKFGSATMGVLTIVDLSLFEPGVMAICVTQLNGTENSPVSWQPLNNVNSLNEYCQFNQTIQTSSVPQQVQFSGLEVDKEYRVYVAAQNTLQVYPDFTDEVVTIKFTTYGMAMEEAVASRSLFFVATFVALLFI